MTKTNQSCGNCNGYGIVGDYGNGEDFYGDKECRQCKGSGMMKIKKKKLGKKRLIELVKMQALDNHMKKRERPDVDWRVKALIVGAPFSV